MQKYSKPPPLQQKVATRLSQPRHKWLLCLSVMQHACWIIYFDLNTTICIYIWVHISWPSKKLYSFNYQQLIAKFSYKQRIYTWNRLLCWVAYFQKGNDNECLCNHNLLNQDCEMSLQSGNFWFWRQSLSFSYYV